MRRPLKLQNTGSHPLNNVNLMESKLRGPLNGAGMYTVSSQGGDLLQDFFLLQLKRNLDPPVALLFMSVCVSNANFSR